MKKIILGVFAIATIFGTKLSYSDNIADCNDVNCLLQGYGQDNPGYEPEDFDSEYVHDENLIIEKKEELLQTLNAFQEIDNIIVTNQLLDAFNGWKGTKYKWGGTTHKGIDCSALTRAIYQEVFNYNLPRVSVDQVKHGRVIKDSELRPGDIVFFRPNNRYNHVGIYIGNSLFINSSSSNGVVISSLDNKYWNKYYKFAVRIDKAREQNEIS